MTEIETWLRDPYAIHARHVLKLEALKPLDEATDAADYGSLVHAGMRHFLKQHGTRWPADAAEQLRRAMARALAEADLREALWPRGGRRGWTASPIGSRTSRRHAAASAHWLPRSSQRCAAHLSWRVHGGRSGWSAAPTGSSGGGDGGLAILDYKTGTPPSQKEVDAGLAPQLAAGGGDGRGRGVRRRSDRHG